MIWPNCGNGRSSCWRLMVAVLRPVPGTRPAKGLGSWVERYDGFPPSASMALSRSERGSELMFVLTASLLTLLPT